MLLGIAGGVGGDLARRGERRAWFDGMLVAAGALGGIAVVSGVVGIALN